MSDVSLISLLPIRACVHASVRERRHTPITRLTRRALWTSYVASGHRMSPKRAAFSPERRRRNGRHRPAVCAAHGPAFVVRLIRPALTECGPVSFSAPDFSLKLAARGSVRPYVCLAAALLLVAAGAAGAAGDPARRTAPNRRRRRGGGRSGVGRGGIQFSAERPACGAERTRVSG